MKKIVYFENAFSPDLLTKIVNLKNTVVWNDHTGRSVISDDVRHLDPNLGVLVISEINQLIGKEIDKCDLTFYKRNTKEFNPHHDLSIDNFLLYLDGGIQNLDNGTMFFSENIENRVSVLISNVMNSAIFFPANYTHTSAQSIHDNTETRYSLNCFIYSYK